MVSVLAAQRVRAIKTEGGRKNLENQYAIEMLNITKKFPGIIANDNITLQLKRVRSMPCSVKTARENRP